MRVSLLRHGLTDWNVERRMQGRTDIPLNAEGRSQVLEAAARLADGPAFDAILTSPLLRAQETAELIADRLGFTSVDEAPWLIERSFGEAEGLNVEEAHSRWPEFTSPGMESDEEVAERGLQGLESLARAMPEGRVLAVSHGAFIRHLLAEIAGIPRASIPRIENVSASGLRRRGAEAVPTGASSWLVDHVAGTPFEEIRLAHEAGSREV